MHLKLQTVYGRPVSVEKFRNSRVGAGPGIVVCTGGHGISACYQELLNKMHVPGALNRAQQNRELRL
ncbi:MAG: hypothetical protein CME19_10195 [Gemmatimonadetes bacterium]|nr:hypothetical protein [Gemmatimonadota bacterium]